MIFQILIIWFVRIHSLKYLRSTTLGCRDKGIKKFEFVAMTQFLCTIVRTYSFVIIFITVLHYTQSHLYNCPTLHSRPRPICPALLPFPISIIILSYSHSVFDLVSLPYSTVHVLFVLLFNPTLPSLYYLLNSPTLLYCSCSICLIVLPNSTVNILLV